MYDVWLFCLGMLSMIMVGFFVVMFGLFYQTMFNSCHHNFTEWSHPERVESEFFVAEIQRRTCVKCNKVETEAV